MVRTTALHLLLGGILRFSTAGHPPALEDCYVALWRLPRPDSHRQVNDDFSRHTNIRSLRIAADRIQHLQ